MYKLVAIIIIIRKGSAKKRRIWEFICENHYFFRIFSIWRSSSVLICWIRGGRVWLISSWSRSCIPNPASCLQGWWIGQWYIAAATWRYWRKIARRHIARIHEVCVVVWHLKIFKQLTLKPWLRPFSSLFH